MLTVYLDPDEPRFSMVWPGLGLDQICDLGLGLALIVIGALGLYRPFLRQGEGTWQ